MDYKPSIVHAEETSGRVWRFADFEFDELRRELRVKGRSVELDAKPLEILLQLLLHAGEVVTKEELLESVWPDVMLVDGSLVTAVSKLRKAMGDKDHPAIRRQRQKRRIVRLSRQPSGPQLSGIRVKGVRINTLAGPGGLRPNEQQPPRTRLLRQSGSTPHRHRKRR